MKSSTVINQSRIIKISSFVDERGVLSAIEGKNDIPFEIKRIFTIFDVPEHISRGAHAHKELHQLLICIKGSVEVKLEDGMEIKTYKLNNPLECLHIPPMLWTTTSNFSEGSVLLVLCSDYYYENDYFRDFDKYLLARKK
mgnify:CR=1 FL=1